MQRGPETGRVRVDGRDRPYRLVPAERSGSPLVVALHGGLQTPEGLDRMSGLDELGPAAGVSVVYPEGVGRTWNAGRCCGPAMREDVDDVSYILTLVDLLIAERGVDARRIYATGISNGGHLAYRLATERAERFAAIAPVAGSMVCPGEPSVPVSVFHVHGTRDRFVPYEGGSGDRSIEPVDYPAVREVVDRWRLFDRCTRGPVIAREGPATIETWGAHDGTEVGLCTIERGGHVWPGPRFPFKNTASAYDATPAILRFLLRHARP